MDRQRDRAGVEAIDTSFTTDVVFDVVARPRSLELVERRLSVPRTKRYPIAEAFAHWAQWEHACVAEDDARIVGFAAWALEAWHERLTLWHLYVQPAWRRRGVGRALLAEVEAEGRRAGARRVWLETSNLNAPGIAAYERLGYALCGADTTLYDGYADDEQAVYLTKRL